MPVFSNQSQFTFKGVDNVTGEKLEGTFTFNRILSYGQQLRYDVLYRKYLGDGDPKYAHPLAQQRAKILAEINSSLISAPAFWVNSDGGLNLLDDNTAVEIWTKIMEVQNEAAEARAAKDKEAAEKLQAKIEKDAAEQEAAMKTKPPEEAK